LIGDLEYQEMSVAEWKLQNIELEGPFQSFKDIAVSAKQQQHVFPVLIIKSSALIWINVVTLTMIPPMGLKWNVLGLKLVCFTN
jgi:hypothetical protein